MNSNFQNVSALLREQAKRWPKKSATILDNGKRLSFQEMEAATCANVLEFKNAGIKTGDRVATFVRPSLDFVPVIFVLFRLGAVPVFIDPGMSVKNMLECVRESKCRAMVGIPLAFILKKFKPQYFKDIEVSVCLSNSSFIATVLGATSLRPASSKALPNNVSEYIESVEPSTLAAILFTSGSTGIPKGVEVTHGILWRQQKILKETFHISDDEIDLVPFPLFALFSAAWGITSIIPAMNPAKPAKCSGQKLFETMKKYKVTHTAGSPAIWNNVLEYTLSNSKTLPDLKRVLMAGAPVSEKLIRGWRKILPEHGHVFTPYGATEALPLTYISDSELIADCFAQTSLGKGTCVGKPLEGIIIKVLKISDDPIENIEDAVELKAGIIGEILVQGDIVTKKYFGRPKATKLAKIQDPANLNLWHRMGDLGYLDEQGRLWFCGRKDHRVQLTPSSELYPAQLEPLFNQLEGIKRTALVGITHPSNQLPNREPVLMVEASKSNPQIEKLLLNKALENKSTETINMVMFVKKFPTDVRHNIKINRQLLSLTAQNRLRETK